MGANIEQISQTVEEGAQMAKNVEKQAVHLQENADSRASTQHLYEGMGKRMNSAIEDAKIVSEVSTIATAIAEALQDRPIFLP